MKLRVATPCPKIIPFLEQLAVLLADSILHEHGISQNRNVVQEHLVREPVSRFKQLVQ